ncbi:pyrophosphatase PpaX [uncultured Clostridium sp.]|uniref:pyrophosphatase PpaX n=1 Tax=uncultured Clostridium sp. TaxID=59620 RepID=UPI00321719E7
MIKAILFDLDGTIIDTNELILTSFNYVLNNYLGLNISKEEIVESFGIPLKDVMDQYAKERAEELVDEYIRYSLESHDKYIKSYDHVEEGLLKLKNKGFKLAIVTSKRRGTALRGLNCFDLEKYFDVIITPEDSKKHKPDGEPVLKACEVLKVKPEETIMVGDSHNDILCWKNAGSKTCLVNYTALNVEKIKTHNPDFIIDKIEDLIELI